MTWQRFGNILLVFLLVFSAPCFSLTSQEIKDLDILPRETLIKIIMRSEQMTNELKKLAASKEIIYAERETELQEREAELSESEKLRDEKMKLFNLQEMIFLESLKMQKIILIKTKFLYGLGGVAAGGLIAYLVGSCQD